MPTNDWKEQRVTSGAYSRQQREERRLDRAADRFLVKVGAAVVRRKRRRRKQRKQPQP